MPQSDESYMSLENSVGQKTLIAKDCLIGLERAEIHRDHYNVNLTECHSLFGNGLGLY